MKYIDIFTDIMENTIQYLANFHIKSYEKTNKKYWNY